MLDGESLLMYCVKCAHVDPADAWDLVEAYVVAGDSVLKRYRCRCGVAFDVYFDPIVPPCEHCKRQKPKQE